MDAWAKAFVAGKGAPFYLFVGDEFLARRDADDFVKKALPDAALGLNLSVWEGASPSEVAADLATLPLFPGPKVVLIREPEFLAPKKGRQDALGKVRDAWKAGRRKDAARRLLALAARAGWGVRELHPSRSGSPSAEDWYRELGIELEEADMAFIKEVAEFCEEEGIRSPEGDVSPLLQRLEKGLPPSVALVAVASAVDARNPLVKWAIAHGQVAERSVAARLKDLDFSDMAAEVVKPFGKRLSAKAHAALKENVGANTRMLVSELEKLALYVKGDTIEAADVQALVAKVREEEYFELSEAISKKDLAGALLRTEDALNQGSHPLALLGTFTGILRNLLEGGERAAQLSKGVPPRSFDDFKSRIFPAIEERAKERKQRVPHPYAAFMSMQAAAKFSRAELARGLIACAETDMKLKSSAPGKLALERLLWAVLGNAPVESCPPPL